MQYITYSPGLTSIINIEGYSFNYTQNVFLSSANITTLALTAYKNNVVETLYGIPYNAYRILSNNILEIYVCNLPVSGMYDIIVANPAGYAKISDFNYLVAYNVT